MAPKTWAVPSEVPAHKIKACMALLGVHRKTLYSTK